jgi:hypothetical protein
VLSEDFPARLAGFQPGSLVAGYRLESQVGAGGMAVVFRARDERLGRLVALKILSPALASDQAFRRRFIVESRAAAAVDDPHIIPVYEAGEANGALFIAMRFVKGGDLRQIRSGKARCRRGARPRSSHRWPPRWTPRTVRAWCIVMSSRRTSWWTHVPAGPTTCTCRTSAWPRERRRR